MVQRDDLGVQGGGRQQLLLSGGGDAMMLDPWLTYGAMQDERERDVERATLLHRVRSVLREQRGPAPLDRAIRDAMRRVTKQTGARITRCCAGGVRG